MGTSGNGHGKGPEAEQRELPVKLTEAELLERGDKMADAEIKIEALKFERAAVGTRIKTQVELRAELAHTIESGTEQRDVRCVWIEDYAKNVRRLVRQDTGECVDTRPMTAADRQGSLGLVDAVAAYPREANEIIDDMRATATRLGGTLEVEVFDADTGEVFDDQLAVEMAKPRGPKMRTRVANPSRPPARSEVGIVDIGTQTIDFDPYAKPKKKRSAGKSRDITAVLKARSAKQRKATTKSKSTRHANA